MSDRAAELNAKALEAWNAAFALGDYDGTPEKRDAINALHEEADRLWAEAEQVKEIEARLIANADRRTPEEQLLWDVFGTED